LVMPKTYQVGFFEVEHCVFLPVVVRV